jgi:Ca2+-dependent lipid-binding protein
MSQNMQAVLCLQPHVRIHHTAPSVSTSSSSSPFVKQPVCCATQVTVQRATGLPAADITGRSDPYVVLSVGDSSATTRVINQELNPVWNETHILYVK